MDDASFKFFKTSALAIIAILLLLLAVVGVVAVFATNTAYTKENSATSPSSTINVYQMEVEGESVTQPVLSNQQYPVQNAYEITKYPQVNAPATRLPQNINVQTTVNVRTSGYTYYPRYSNHRYYKYNHNYPRPYGFKYGYPRSPYYGYGYGVYRGSYSYRW